MAFNPKEIEILLANTGRMCCICGFLHKVQVHHIVPKYKGGTDDIDNAISLCPNCHDEVHGQYAPGRISRMYTPDELKAHRQRTIELARRGKDIEIGGKIELTAKNGDEAIGVEITDNSARFTPGTEINVSTEKVKKTIGLKIGKTDIKFGYKCEKCKSSFNLLVNSDKCPMCGGKLILNEDAGE